MTLGFFLLDLDEWEDWSVFLATTLRISAIILLAIAAGLMARYYLTRPRMPMKAFVGYAAYTFALMGTLVHKIQEAGSPFRWWLSPPVIIGAVYVIWGVWPAMAWRRGRVDGDKSDWVSRSKLWRRRYREHPGEGVFDEDE